MQLHGGGGRPALSVPRLIVSALVRDNSCPPAIMTTLYSRGAVAGTARFPFSTSGRGQRACNDTAYDDTEVTPSDPPSTSNNDCSLSLSSRDLSR